MKVIDVRRLDAGAELPPCQICIVGAGAAGSYLAHRLAAQGVDVAVVEAGGKVCVPGDELGVGLDLGTSGYRAATEGRAFGLGGTTSLWGGQLIPYSSSDAVRVSESAKAVWSHILATIARHQEQVLRTLGLEPADPDNLFEEASSILSATGLELRASSWLAFQERNLSRLLQQSVGDLTVYLHAVAKTWTLDGGHRSPSRIRQLTVTTDGCERVLRAQHYVIASGTIESARILLELSCASPDSPLPAGAAVGVGLSDHLSSTVAQVPAEARERIAELFGPRFHSGTMRSARLLEREPAPESPRGFFHFIFELTSSGFHVARKVLAGVQAKRLPEVGIGELLRGAASLAALGWSKSVRSRLHIPPGTNVHLQLDTEQHPSSSNRIRLGDHLDAMGRPVAIVDWKIHERDQETIMESARTFEALWRKLPSLPSLRFASPTADAVKPHDAYHPVGVCRMGRDEEAVVDMDLRVRQVENLWMLSTAVFPSAGTANPALSMLCLGEQLSHQLTQLALPHA